MSDFPEREDFSTPEAAYAVINRVMASGNEGAWRRISVREIRKRLPPANAEKKEVKPEVAKRWLNAHIVEVWIYRDKYARIIAESPGDPVWPFDLRLVELEDGKWLNRGQDGAKSLEAARTHSARSVAFVAKRPARPPIDHPESYLESFVEFLRTEGSDPLTFVLQALKDHRVTIMGEIHHRPLYWAFNSLLVTQPDFPRHVGTIYMELPSNDQALVDEFLTAQQMDRTPIIKMLRDMLWMGWPDQPMMDFFTTVWMVNQQLPSQLQLRIVLVDMQRPWMEIKEKGDWDTYDVDRDHFMAANILKDIETRPTERRNALFIVGVGHTMLNLEYIEGYPMKSAGWHLRRELGAQNAFAIFQHRPVMTNMGRVDGRIHLGLFDSAFAALGNKPIAFSLSRGPFGEQPYDCSPDKPSACSRYRDGYSAYLFLGPLEHEVFSPLIAGFYTDEFVKELERRYHLMHGKSWSQAYKRESNAASFIAWMGAGWGTPRKWRNSLGPMNAWQHGDDWERIIRTQKHQDALEHPQVIIRSASRLFDAIQTADYNHPQTVRRLNYTAHHWVDVWSEWVCKTFRHNPIVSVELGEVSAGQDDRPTVPYSLTLKNGKRLEGRLPFQYLPRQERWQAWTGLDWHLTNAQNPGDK
ncbi:MAG: hypothetical protein JSW59_03420 [Phycisphaerales bacterium]|nr:MAG: hypothetical protein JSW59_03420 [Phycisphaerales bacterium]